MQLAWVHTGKSIQGGLCTGQSLRAACRLTVEWIQSDVLAEVAAS